MPDSNTPISQRPTHAHTAHRKYGPRIYLSIGSAFVCAVLTLVYVIRPLGADPITIWPFWFWALPAIALSVFGISRRNLLCGIAATVMWVAVVAIVPEEPAMLLRSWFIPTSSTRASIPPLPTPSASSPSIAPAG